MENGGEIYKAIPAAIKLIGAVAKTRKNKEQGFDYRGIDDVYDALNPVLGQCGITIVTEMGELVVSTRKSRAGYEIHHLSCKVTFTLFASDGSSIKTEVLAEAMDSGDKCRSKLMSIAYKSMALMMFCIPVTNIPDPDANSYQSVADDSAEIERLPPASEEPKPRTAPEEPKADAMYLDAMKRIESAATIETAMMLQNRVNESTKFTPSQKDALLEAVASKLASLSETETI